jgi:hypothetical protein
VRFSGKWGLLAAVSLALSSVAAQAQNCLDYSFTEPIKSASVERFVTISFRLSARDAGGFSATYSHMENVTEALEDVATISFERERMVTPTEGDAFFESLIEAGIKKLPKAADAILEPPNSQLWAKISNEEIRRNYNSRATRGPRKAVHDNVLGFAKKLGIDSPEDRGKATRVIEGNRTPARVIPFSSLITNPNRYGDKRIAVVGYYHYEFEYSALTSAPHDWKNFSFDHAFWFGSPSRFAKDADVRHWKNDTWVKVEGVFVNQFGGHMGGYPGTITRITRMESLPGPPKPAPEANEDDPHGLEALMDEIIIKPFPMDGRPVAEVVAALNKQIAEHLADRGKPRDWLKITLDTASNPKARTDVQFDSGAPLRAVVMALGGRVAPDEPAAFEGANTYSYILPDTIRLRFKTSVYHDDKEPFSFSDERFQDQSVRVKTARKAARWAGPDTFDVSWTTIADPVQANITDAIKLARKVLPDEDVAKRVTGVWIRGSDVTWRWLITAGGSADEPSIPGLGGVSQISPGKIYPSPLSSFENHSYVATLSVNEVASASKWKMGDNVPLDIGDALKAARSVLARIKRAKETLVLSEISFGPLDETHWIYQIAFRDPSDADKDYLTIPVLLSGKAIAPKRTR